MGYELHVGFYGSHESTIEQLMVFFTQMVLLLCDVIAIVRYDDGNYLVISDYACKLVLPFI